MPGLGRLLFPFLIPGLVTLSGCTGQARVDPAEVARQRTRLTLAEEPDGAQTVLDVRAVMYGEAVGEDDHDHADDDHTDADHADEHGDDEHQHTGESADHADHGHGHAGAHASTAIPKITEMDVVMVGTVGGVANPSQEANPEFPFAKNQAVFFLADPEAVAELEEHGHQHAPGEECSFCAAHAGDSAGLIAAVQFKDENGKVLAVDIRELFGLKEKETVVVRGKAHLTPSGMLTVDADGFYVRR